MSEAEDSRLYGLMEIAEGQQAAVQTALEGLAAERAALRQERDKLTREVQKLELGLRGTVRSAVTDSLAGAAAEGVEAVQVATRPLLGQLAGVTERAGQAETALRQVVLWAGGRLMAWMVGTVAALVLLGWLASNAVLWWDTRTIAAAQVQKMQLTTEVAKLRAEIIELGANRDTWVQAGMLDRVEHCGPKSRPCVRVDENAGLFGNPADFRVLQKY